MEIHIDRRRSACKDMGITEKGGGPAKWKVAIDRERWPTVEVAPLKQPLPLSGGIQFLWDGCLLRWWKASGIAKADKPPCAEGRTGGGSAGILKVSKGPPGNKMKAGIHPAD